MLFVFGSLHKNRENIKSGICLFLLLAGECFQIFVILSSPFWETSPSLNLVNRAAMTAAFILATSVTTYWVFVCFSVLSLPFLFFVFSVYCVVLPHFVLVCLRPGVRALGSLEEGLEGFWIWRRCRSFCKRLLRSPLWEGLEASEKPRWENKPRVL